MHQFGVPAELRMRNRLDWAGAISGLLSPRLEAVIATRSSAIIIRILAKNEQLFRVAAESPGHVARYFPRNSHGLLLENRRARYMCSITGKVENDPTRYPEDLIPTSRRTEHRRYAKIIPASAMRESAKGSPIVAARHFDKATPQKRGQAFVIPLSRLRLLPPHNFRRAGRDAGHLPIRRQPTVFGAFAADGD